MTADLEANFKKWEFNLMDAWQEDNPSAEVVKEHNPPIVKFSDDEISQIFSGEGSYRVMYFQKKEATSDASIGTIHEGGMSYMGDTALASDRYTIIRAVLRTVFSSISGFGGISTKPKSPGGRQSEDKSLALLLRQAIDRRGVSLYLVF